MSKEFKITIGLHLKFTLFIALIIAIMMFFVNQIISTEVQSALKGEIIHRGAAIANNLAILAMEPLTKIPIDDLTLSSTVTELEEKYNDIHEVFILDPNNRIIAHNDFLKSGKMYVPPAGVVLDNQIIREVQFFKSNQAQDLIFLTAPVTFQSQQIATTHVIMSTDKIFLTMDKLRADNQMITFIGIVIAIILTSAVVKVLTEPIDLLMKGVEGIGLGNFNQHIDIRFHDEIGALTQNFNEMAANLKEKEILKSALKTYIPTQILDKIKENPDMLTPGGTNRVLSIMFVDIRGFTHLSEGSTPHEIVELLNQHLTAVSEVIVEHGGWVDKFMGDAVMSFFGSPILYEDHNVRAVNAAIKIQKRVAEMNKIRVQNGKRPIGIGIGINTGEAQVGIIGTKEKMDYTVIGDAVNVAQRLESISKPGQILISRNTSKNLGRNVLLIEHEPVKVKGKDELVEIFEATPSV